MKKLIRTTVLAIAFASPAAFAQETLLEYVVEACDTDLVEFCDQVTPGEGRLLYCVAAHEDKISGECAIALYDAATVMQELVNTIAYLAESCDSDIETFCADAPLGEGRILACLEKRGDELSASCRTAIDEVVVEEE